MVNRRSKDYCETHGPLDVEKQLRSLDACQRRALDKVVGAATFTGGAIGLIVGLILAWFVAVL